MNTLYSGMNFMDIYDMTGKKDNLNEYIQTSQSIKCCDIFLSFLYCVFLDLTL